jgi:glycosyltransferase involved in cell wall biosynthesis
MAVALDMFREVSTMRVLFYGNQGNHGYRFVKALRAKGINAVLFMQENSVNNRSRPEWEDLSLKGNYPSWIQTFKSGWGYNLALPERKVVKASKECDVVITAGRYVVSALALKKPLVFLSVGGDLTQLPFATTMRAQWQAFIYRRRIRTISRIVTAQEDCTWAARFLRVYDKVVHFPLPIDVDRISARVDHELLADLERRYRHYDWVFFNPSRKNLDSTKIDYKGSDKLLLAFRELVSSSPSLNIKLVFGMHGLHVSEFRDMVDRLKLTPYCDFVDQLSLPQLYAYMCLKQVVVFDHFGIVALALGGIIRDALSLGTLVVTSADINASHFLSLYGPECPIFPAFETEDIVDVTRKIIELPPERIQSIRKVSTSWAYKYFDWENRIDKLIEILEEVVRGRCKTSQ